MVRAPCCDSKMGLKKGQWTPEEDRMLISYINKHGHSNWRALPKLAGLLRCGKSCRLRWTNYLKPDIKRGNFSKEEEDTIIMLHQILGNRWSRIAAELPGRTDNEIKNVWHTHLKKRLINPKQESNHQETVNETEKSTSSMSSCSENSSVSHESSIQTDCNLIKLEAMDSSEIFPVIDEEFWSEPEQLSISSSSLINHQSLDEQIPFIDEDMKFWYSLLVSSESLQDLI